MTYKAYVDDIFLVAKSGKAPEGYRKMSRESGFVKHGDILRRLAKDPLRAGHCQAKAIIVWIQDPEVAERTMAEDAKRGRSGGGDLRRTSIPT